MRSAPRHGHARRVGWSRTYRIWCAMRTRCSNPQQKDWHRYGGRGIRVCERWRSFEAFLADMGECPLSHTLERVDRDGQYEPGNCRWASRAEQSRNTLRTVLLEHQGRRLCLKDWARETGIGYGTLRSRVRYGWDAQRILTEPVGENQGRHR